MPGAVKVWCTTGRSHSSMHDKRPRHFTGNPSHNARSQTHGSSHLPPPSPTPVPQTTSYLCSPPPQVKEGTKEVAHKTGEALSSAATAVGHQVGRWVGEKGKEAEEGRKSGRREGKRGRWVGYAALRAV